MAYSTRNNDDPVGLCPRCGREVYEQKPGYFCGDRVCGFGIWKKNKFFEFKRTEVTREIVAALLKEGRVFVCGLYSDRTNKTYNADIVLDDAGDGIVKFKIEIPPKGEKANG